MELFDKKFVYFMWDDKLEGKTGHVSNDIKCLCDYVNNNPSAIELIEHSSDESQPFQTTDGIRFRFFYYDPNYEAKKAFNEGKKVQTLLLCDVDWRDVENEDAFEQFIEEGRPFRIKPEDEKSKRMTYRQLAEWTNKQNGEIKSPIDPGYVFCDFSYREGLENEELPGGYRIRCWGSDEWVEPTVDIYKEDCK